MMEEGKGVGRDVGFGVVGYQIVPHCTVFALRSYGSSVPGTGIHPPSSSFFLLFITPHHSSYHNTHSLSLSSTFLTTLSISTTIVTSLLPQSHV